MHLRDVIDLLRKTDEPQKVVQALQAVNPLLEAAPDELPSYAGTPYSPLHDWMPYFESSGATLTCCHTPGTGGRCGTWHSASSAGPYELGHIRTDTAAAHSLLLLQGGMSPQALRHGCRYNPGWLGWGLMLAACPGELGRALLHARPPEWAEEEAKADGDKPEHQRFRWACCTCAFTGLLLSCM